METQLVADYGSDDEDDDSGDGQEKADELEEESFKPKTDSVTVSGSSSSTSDSDSEDEEKGNSQPHPQKVQLFNPFRSADDKVKKEDSVFQIPFREQEKSESAALEKHVKMTPVVGSLTTINGKKICWNHRKGKCRFGSNCTFAHDSDIYVPDSNTDKQSKLLEPVLPSNQPKHLSTSCMTRPEPANFEQAYITSSAQLGGLKQKTKQVESDEDLEATHKDNLHGTKFGKKRPGLSQTLVPGKKVMKNYYEQKNK